VSLALGIYLAIDEQFDKIWLNPSRFTAGIVYFFFFVLLDATIIICWSAARWYPSAIEFIIPFFGVLITSAMSSAWYQKNAKTAQITYDQWTSLACQTCLYMFNIALSCIFTSHYPSSLAYR
jgi:hypothetical protein